MKTPKALLVIDMQKGSFTPKTPRFDTEDVVNRINELAAVLREQDYPVIYIQHDGTGSGHFEKNTWEWENLDDLVITCDSITWLSRQTNFYLATPG